MNNTLRLTAKATGLAVIVGGLGLGVANAGGHDGDEHGHAHVVYTAKVICSPSGVTTAINVHNP